MFSCASVGRLLLLGASLCVLGTKANNTTASFEIVRESTSCAAIDVTASSETASDVAAASANETSSCIILDGAEIQQMNAYTTFEQDNVSIEARIGPLTAINSIPRLNYECPPDFYNGFDYRYSFCQPVNDTMLTVAYVSPEDNMLWGLDVILAGTPFPAELSVNEPPFGAARYNFDGPIALDAIGSLLLCPGTHTVTCPGVNAEETLSLKGLVFSGFGSFVVEGLDYESSSIWIHDDDLQLLHLTAGEATGFWFNASGYFLADYVEQTCIWLPNCNFECEVYNYDSRFFDYIGTWFITGKKGSPDFTNTTAKVYLGNAIDAAGVFPCLMYISVDGGYYLGLDKLDTTVGTGGSSFWYSQIVPGKPNFTDYPLPTNLDCPGTTEQFLLPAADSPSPAPNGSPGSPGDNANPSPAPNSSSGGMRSNLVIAIKPISLLVAALILFCLN